MQKQKERARNAAAVETGDWVVVKEGETEFKGWDYTEHECHILRYRKVTQKKQTFYQIVLDYTPFYAEMGGQVGDRGVLCSEHETIEIVDTKRENNLPVHIAKTLPEHPEADFMACVDTDLRAASEANHTCTHPCSTRPCARCWANTWNRKVHWSPGIPAFRFLPLPESDRRATARSGTYRQCQNPRRPALQDHRDMPIEKAKELGLSRSSERNTATGCASCNSATAWNSVAVAMPNPPAVSV